MADEVNKRENDRWDTAGSGSLPGTPSKAFGAGRPCRLQCGRDALLRVRGGCNKEPWRPIDWSLGFRHSSFRLALSQEVSCFAETPFYFRPMSEPLTTLLETAHEFAARHIGPSADEKARMLQDLGFAGLDSFIAQVVPPSIRLANPLRLPAGRDEHAVLAELRAIAGKNQVFRSFIGMGYSDCFTPPVIQRNILENPGWYTPYTPYQAEISQGRLEALFNFQTLTSDLTGLPIANASLLDEATAAAEAMHLCQNAKPGAAPSFSSRNPAIRKPLKWSAPAPVRWALKSSWAITESSNSTTRFFGALVQYPATDGAIFDYENFRPPGPRRRAPCWWWRRICWRSPCCARRGNSARTWRWAARNVSACPWVTAALMPPFSPPPTPANG